MASDLPDNQKQQSQRPDTRILTLNLLQSLAQWRVSTSSEPGERRDEIHQKGKILVAKWLVKSSQPDSTDFVIKILVNNKIFIKSPSQSQPKLTCQLTLVLRFSTVTL